MALAMRVFLAVTVALQSLPAGANLFQRTSPPPGSDAETQNAPVVHNIGQRGLCIDYLIKRTSGAVEVGAIEAARQLLEELKSRPERYYVGEVDLVDQLTAIIKVNWNTIKMTPIENRRGDHALLFEGPGGFREFNEHYRLGLQVLQTLAQSEQEMQDSSDGNGAGSVQLGLITAGVGTSIFGLWTVFAELIRGPLQRNMELAMFHSLGFSLGIDLRWGLTFVALAVGTWLIRALIPPLPKFRTPANRHLALPPPSAPDHPSYVLQNQLEQILRDIFGAMINPIPEDQEVIRYFGRSYAVAVPDPEAGSPIYELHHFDLIFWKRPGDTPKVLTFNRRVE